METPLYPTTRSPSETRNGNPLGTIDAHDNDLKARGRAQRKNEMSRHRKARDVKASERHDAHKIGRANDAMYKLCWNVEQPT